MPPTASNSTVLAAFTPRRESFSEAIVPGDRLVTLLGGMNGGATWWEKDMPVTVRLPNSTVNGSRISVDGTSLRVGLGTLDFAARTWTPAASLESWNRSNSDGSKPLRDVAWFADAIHVALLIEQRTRDGARSQEIVVVSATDGKVRGRQAIDSSTAMIASEDRILVAIAGSTSPVLLDIDANVVLASSRVADSVYRLNYGGGMFVTVGATGVVTLIRPSDGAALATWDIHAKDAVPVENGVVVVDEKGLVRVGCLEGKSVRQVAEVAADVQLPIVQRVGDRIVVAGSVTATTNDWIQSATFVNPCRAPGP